jgi:hypothetical protein
MGAGRWSDKPGKCAPLDFFRKRIKLEMFWEKLIA